MSAAISPGSEARTVTATAVVCDAGTGLSAQLEHFLAARGLAAAARYAPRDINDVERGIASGAIQHVVFATPTQLLELLWSAELDPDCWRRPELQIEFASAADPAAREGLPASLLAAWQQHRRRQRHARIVAGLILSILAIGAAFVLLLALGGRVALR